MRDFATSDLVIDHLNLGTFATIYQVIIAVERYHLACRVAVKCRNSRIVAKNSNSEHALKYDNKFRAGNRAECEYTFLVLALFLALYSFTV